MTHIATIPQTTSSELDQPTGSVYRTDRRRAERRDSAGQITALRFMTASRPCTTTGLELRNMSETGIAAVSTASMEIGEPVALYFGSHGCDCPSERIGRVVRCRSTDQLREHSIAPLPLGGFDVAIQFDDRAAA